MTGSASEQEVFVTLFDSGFLPMGLAQHDSLMRHHLDAHLWIVCMDQTVEEQLRRLDLKNVSLIPLRDMEAQFPALLKAKASRSFGEYCWTMTPFTFDAVFARDANAQRVTYVDADVFFLKDPKLLLDELTLSHKSVLITDHAYAPEYDQATYRGRFCVQFLTSDRTDRGLKVIRWWQDRCIEWCFARVEGDKFGDQKYLDKWPTLFGDAVHILEHKARTLAPWNVTYYTSGQPADPGVMYHFHGLRFVGPDRVRLFQGYRIGAEGLKVYDEYVKVMREVCTLMRSLNFAIPFRTEAASLNEVLRRLLRRIRGRERYATV